MKTPNGTLINEEHKSQPRFKAAFVLWLLLTIEIHRQPQQTTKKNTFDENHKADVSKKGHGSAFGETSRIHAMTFEGKHETKLYIAC